MSEEELKLTRRLFLQHTAVAAAMGTATAGISLKTDALAQEQAVFDAKSSPQDILPYAYHEDILP
jgi:hypothetical protein